MKMIKKILLALIMLVASCLTPIDRARQQVTTLLGQQHQALVDFVHWDRLHQIAIITGSKTKTQAKSLLTHYRGKREVLLGELLELLRDEDPDVLVGLLDSSQVDGIVNKLKKQVDDLLAKILEFERTEND